LPDLDVASITVYEDAGVVKLVIDVRNTGPGNAGRFLVSAVCAGRAPTEVVDGLASGSDARITFSLDDPPGPDLVPQVAVDPRDELLESNEDNNVSLIDDPLCGIPALQFPSIGWQAHAAG